MATKSSDITYTTKMVSFRETLKKLVVTKNEAMHLMTITPGMAAVMLERNTEHNRNPIRGRQIKYAAAMASGRWLLSGQAIQFDWDGVMIDGQNRLLASIESNTPFRCWVATGLDPAVFDRIDQQGTRTPTHVMKMAGIKYPGDVSTASRIAFLAEMDDVSMISHGGFTARKRGDDPTPDLLLDFVLENERLSHLIAQHKSLYNDCTFFSGGMCLGLHYLLDKKHPVKALTFMEQLCAGENLTKNDSVWHLRQLFDKKTKKIDDRLPAAHKIAMCIDCFNAKKLKKTFNIEAGSKFPAVQ